MVLFCALLGTAASQEGIVLDKRQLSIGFEVHSLGIWRIAGYFTEASAEIAFNAGEPARSRLKVVANTASISTSSPTADAHLRSASFFDAERYPVLTFESTKIEFMGPSSGVVTGNLSLIGVTRPVRLTFDLLDRTVSDGLRRSAGRIRAMGVLRRSDWGMTALVPAVSDEVRLDIEVEAQAAR